MIDYKKCIYDLLNKIHNKDSLKRLYKLTVLLYCKEES